MPPSLMLSGDERDRTANLLVANQALSQLSYVPVKTASSRSSERKDARAEARSVNFWMIAAPARLIQADLVIRRVDRLGADRSAGPSEELAPITLAREAASDGTRAAQIAGAGVSRPAQLPRIHASAAKIAWARVGHGVASQFGTSPWGDVVSSTHCWIIWGDWLT